MNDGPQAITRRGREIVVVVSVDELHLARSENARTAAGGIDALIAATATVHGLQA